MDVSYSSLSGDPGAELRALRRTLDTQLLGLDIVPNTSSEPVEALFRSNTLDDLQIARHSGTPVTAYRTPRQIHRSPRDDYLIALPLRGTALLAQRGRRIDLRPGDLTVIDCDEPYALRLADSFELLTVRVPQDRLTSGRPLTPEATAIRLDPDSPPAQLLASYFRALAEPGWNGCGLSSRFLDTGFELLTATLRESTARLSPTRTPGLLESVLRETRRRLAESGLHAADVAVACHISVRQLHRLFAERGITFGSWLREERLRRCHLDLHDPALVLMPIAEIGHRWGYPDAAHFSRSFSQRFGLSPKIARQEAAAKKALPTRSVESGSHLRRESQQGFQH
jgi:AraC-like DNA-binding protein